MSERPRDACFAFDQRPALFAKLQNCIFEQPYEGIRGNISALSESFNAKKLCSSFIERMSVLFVEQRISVSEPPFGGLKGNVYDSSSARWIACSRLPTGYNWTFFTSSYGCSTNTSKSAFVEEGWVILRLNIRLKSYVYRHHLSYSSSTAAILFSSTYQRLPSHLYSTFRILLPVWRLVLGLDHRANITPALKKLHWLPVRHHITFKIATLMHSILHRDCPTYLCDLIHFINTGSNRSRLWSATARAATTVWTRTKFGDRRTLSLEQSSTVATAHSHIQNSVDF